MTKAVAEKAMDYGIHRFLADGVHYRDWADIRAAMPSWEEWPQTWAKWAADTEERADAELAKGSTLTAAADYARAALYYHTGQYLLFDDLELKKRIHDSKIAAFSKGLEHFATPIERVEIPFKNITMPGYFRVPAGVDNPPCVVLLGGLDTTKEDYLVVSDMLIARGIATIGFDGPGQGETFFKMALEQDFEKSVSAVIDYVEKRPEIDKNRIGLVGRSLGGYWGPKTAATDDRVKALVCWGVIYDYENFDNIKTAHYSTYVGLKAVTGLDDEAVTWSLEDGEVAGRVGPDGFYNASAGAGIYQLRATSVADPTVWATAEIRVSMDWLCPEEPPEPPFELVWSHEAPRWSLPWSSPNYPLGEIAWHHLGLWIASEYCVQHWSAGGEFLGWSGLGLHWDGVNTPEETYVGYHEGFDPLDAPINGDQDGAFTLVEGIALDALGNVYAGGAFEIVKLGPNGVLLDTWDQVDAESIVAAADTRIWVLGYGSIGTYGIHRFEATGQYLSSLVELDGEPYLHWASSARHLAGFDSQGDLFFPYRYGAWAVSILTPELAYAGSTVRRGADNCTSQDVRAVVDADGNLILADAGYKRFDRNGWLLSAWPDDGYRARGMTLDPEGNLYAACYRVEDGTYWVRKYAPPASR